MFLADIDNASIGLVVQSLSVLATLVLTLVLLFKGLGGKDRERNVQPTEFHAINTELKAQTATLNHINREVGEVKTRVDTLAGDVNGFHIRVGGISRELAATSARVDGLEKREASS